MLQQWNVKNGFFQIPKQKIEILSKVQRDAVQHGMKIPLLETPLGKRNCIAYTARVILIFNGYT